MPTKKVTKQYNNPPLKKKMKLEKLADNETLVNGFAVKYDTKLGRYVVRDVSESLEKLRDEKFGTNTFAKKYREELNDFVTMNYMKEIAESADQVKFWSRHERAVIYDQIARSIVMFLLGVIIGVVIMGV